MLQRPLLFRPILSRYLAREILVTTLAVTMVLLLIFLSGRFAKYLVDAATGKISAEIIFFLLLYRIPNLLERILPLGLFLGILLVFGRLYVENEIAAMHAAGISVPALLWSSGFAIVPVILVTAAITLYISPAGFQQVEKMLNHEKKRSELELVEAGKFLPLRARYGTIYTGEIGEGKQTMSDVFIVTQHMDGQWTIVRAESGFQHYDASADQRFFTLQNGARYRLSPGHAQGERLLFDTMRQLMSPPEEFDPRKLKEDTLSTARLLQEPGRPTYMATLQWRVSVIVLVPLVAILAVAISRTSPRQGRYIKLLPAMLLYFAYIAALDILRHKMGEGDWPILPGMFVAHAVFVLIALYFLYGTRWLAWRRR